MRISDWSSDVCSSDLIGDGPVRQRRFACRYRLRRLAAAQVQHHLRRKREAVSEKAGIDSALEPRPCVGRQAQLATGRADRLRTEIGAFDDDIGGRLGDARMVAADRKSVV